MNTQKSNSLKIAAIVFVVMIVLLYGMVHVGLPLFAIGCENLLVKWEARNPYIDTDFFGWKTIHLSACGSMMIPEGWSYRERDGISFLYDEAGSLWAMGAAKGGEGDRFGSLKEMLEFVEHTRISEIHTEPIVPFLMMAGSTAVRIFARENGTESTCCCIKLFLSTERELIWVLETDVTGNAGQYDLVEAMVYSHAFGNG